VAKVPVIELQHGVIHDYHLGYSYPKNHFKKTYPDYLFVFGDFWKEAVDFPIKKEQIISVGYPYLESEAKKNLNIAKKKQIIFLSQPGIGEILSDFAIEVSKIKDLGYELVFKLHPIECDSWKEDYPDLTLSNINVIDTKEATLYRLFAESSVQVGVYSTAIYEGLTFDLQTFILDSRNVDFFDKVIETGYANKISTVKEFLASIKKQEQEKKKIDQEHFFKSKSIENIITKIEEIIERKQIIEEVLS